jgi:hypothetical protein
MGDLPISNFGTVITKCPTVKTKSLRTTWYRGLQLRLVLQDDLSDGEFGEAVVNEGIKFQIT